MKAKELKVSGWCKKEHYSINETSRRVCEELLSIYGNPLVAKMVLSKSVELLDMMDIDGETWRELPDYEGLYLISNKGRVKSCSRQKNSNSKFAYISKEKVLKPSVSKDGYLNVFLCKDGKSKSFAIHRLVAIAFIPNGGKLSDVNHKDENKLNNSVENLEWCTKEYNTKYGTRTQRVSKRISQFTTDGEFVRTFNSVKEASRTLHIGSSNIHNCAVGKKLKKDGKEYVCRSAGGYLWRYADDHLCGIEKEITL